MYYISAVPLRDTHSPLPLMTRGQLKPACVLGFHLPQQTLQIQARHSPIDWLLSNKAKGMPAWGKEKALHGYHMAGYQGD